MCDNCPSTACSPATPKSARRKHPGNPRVRISRDDVAALRSYARAGWTDAEALHHVLWTVGMAEAHKAEAARLTRERDDAIRERDAERATVEAYSDLLRRSEEEARKLAEERNKLTARLARFDALAASLVCKVEQDGGDTVVTLTGYPEVVGRDRSPTVARLEAAVSAAGYLPSVVADMARARGEALRGEDAQLDRANAAEAKLADERQAHAATAAALAACNARVENLTAALATVEANAADSARRIEAQRKMLEVRDARLESQTWTIAGLGIGLAIALLGMALVVA